mmetsp:Transcript_17390/g.15339  ORF Transcript_17390/g.15339 Transcript_17390/m.15339 type:complete len:133 (+) Transcript_17390:45-443(+)
MMKRNKLIILNPKEKEDMKTLKHKYPKYNLQKHKVVDDKNNTYMDKLNKRLNRSNKDIIKGLRLKEIRKIESPKTNNLCKIKQGTCENISQVKMTLAKGAKSDIVKNRIYFIKSRNSDSNSISSSNSKRVED